MKKKLKKKIIAIPVKAFDFFDTERKNPIDLYLCEVKKGHKFHIDAVEYKVTKVFKKKKYKEKCVELKMIAYKISNTVTKHIHICQAQQSEMARTDDKHIKKMVEKYGEATVERMVSGRVVLQIPGKYAVCKSCGVKFWKHKVESVETVDVLSHEGKKKLKKRK